MSEFKGTKGLWSIKHSESKTAFNIVGTRLGDKYKIARVPYLNFQDDSLKLKDAERKQAYFDALLISKAPEMLEMLKEVLKGRIRPREYKSEWDMVNELIKSATEVKESK